MGIYAALGVIQAFMQCFFGILLANFGYKISRNLQRKTMLSVSRAPSGWFDVNPVGRILSRFTKDLDILDNNLINVIRMSLSDLSQLVGAITLVAIVEKFFLVTIIPVALAYYIIYNFYQRTSRELKRLDNLLRSDVYAHFSEALTGLACIRAFNDGEKFVQSIDDALDRQTRAYYSECFNDCR